MNSMLREVVINAYVFAKNAHKDQVRKFNDLPYFTHCKAVARMVEELTHDPEMVAAALLHDVVEDCEVELTDLLETFGSRVVGLVDELTNEKNHEGYLNNKKEYLVEKLSNMSEDAFLIKLCDMIHNTMFLETDCFGNGFESFARNFYDKIDYVLKNINRKNQLNKRQKVAMDRLVATMGFVKFAFGWK